MQVRLLSVQTETPEGGVVVRKSAHVSGKLVKMPAVATGGKLPLAEEARTEVKLQVGRRSRLAQRGVSLGSYGRPRMTEKLNELGQWDGRGGLGA